MEGAVPLPLTDAGTLKAIVGRALADEQVEIAGWQATPLTGGYGFLAGLSRVSGRASLRGALVPWSVVLKRSVPPDSDAALPATANWRREFHVYQSELLASLREGFVAPLCYGAEDRGQEGLWLWIEDLGDVDALDAHAWPPERFRLVAHHVGIFNGSYLAGRTLPSASWLCTEWLRKWISVLPPTLRVDLGRASTHQFAGRLVPAELAERLVRLCEERAGLLAVLERLPQTFCHNDLNRHNLFVRPRTAGGSQIVAIDWEDAGISAVGEELAALVVSSLRWDAAARAKLGEVDTQAFAGYLEGLRAAGWQGDPRLVRFAYATRAALWYAVFAGLWPLRLAAGSYSPERLESAFECTFDEVVARHTQTLGFVLDLADEAQDLLPSVSSMYQ
jgi:hypothetical protein